MHVPKSVKELCERIPFVNTHIHVCCLHRRGEFTTTSAALPCAPVREVQQTLNKFREAGVKRVRDRLPNSASTFRGGCVNQACRMPLPMAACHWQGTRCWKIVKSKEAHVAFCTTRQVVACQGYLAFIGAHARDDGEHVEVENRVCGVMKSILVKE
mgnify:CR=1 FL=1